MRKVKLVMKEGVSYREPEPRIALGINDQSPQRLHRDDVSPGRVRRSREKAVRPRGTVRSGSGRESIVTSVPSRQLLSQPLQGDLRTAFAAGPSESFTTESRCGRAGKLG